MSDKSMEIKAFKGNVKTGDDGSSARNSRRRAVLWPANIVVNEHVFPAQIRNFSLGGAKVKFDIPLKENSIVKLEIPSKRVSFKCEVVWQSHDTIGLIFLESRRAVKESFGNQAEILGLLDDFE